MYRTVEAMETLDGGHLLSSTLSDPHSSELARVLKALADSVRLKLVNVIATSGEPWAWFRVKVDRLAEICAVIR